MCKNTWLHSLGLNAIMQGHFIRQWLKGGREESWLKGGREESASLESSQRLLSVPGTGLNTLTPSAHLFSNDHHFFLIDI